EKAMLMRPSAFAGGFTLEAADAIGSGESAANEDVLDILTQLVDKSLVVVDRAGEEARYRLLETIRQYAREKLFESASAASTRALHLDFYLSLAERTEPLLAGSEQRVWLDLLEAEHDNLRAALEWSASGVDDQSGLRLASALWRFWWVRGYWSEGRVWLDKALSLRGEEVSSPRAKALWAGGFLAHFQGDYSTALSLSKQSLEMFRQAGDEAMAAYPLFNLGYTTRSMGRTQDARSHLEQSLSTGRKFGDKQVMAWSLLIIGGVFAAEGNDIQARSSCEEALRLAREAGDKWNVATALNDMGTHAARDGDFPTARSLHTEAIEMRRELGDKFGLQQSLLNLGLLSQGEGDLSAARSYFEEGLEIARGLGDRTYLSSALTLMGNLALAEGDPSSALTFLGESIAIARKTANDAMLASALNNAAWILHVNGHELQARGFAEESVTIERRLDREAYLAAALHTLGEILRSQGQLEPATTLYREALGFTNPEATVAAILHSLAALASSQDRFDRAARLFGAAEAIRESKGLTLPTAEQGIYDRHVSVARNGGGSDFETAWEAGRTLSLEEAVRYALESAEPGRREL
ncbi:MAG: tetratricopeptide repeat protein, partial [Actinomycetota bacterium]